jgi:type I restriction enzyme M protein
MDERKRNAAMEARPYKEQSTAKDQEAAQWKERLITLKKAKPRDESAIAEAEAKAAELSREAREAAAKAKEIEDAVFDLKAVNPNKKPVVDTRTPEELLAIIETKGKEIAHALAVLKSQ